MLLAEILTKNVGRYVKEGPHKGKIVFVIGETPSGLVVQLMSGIQLHGVKKDDVEDIEAIKTPLEVS